MSQENVDLVREVHDGWARGDFGIGADRLALDFEWHQFPQAVEPGTRRGEEVGGALRKIFDVYENVRVEATEFVDAGDKVVVIGRTRGTAKGSDLQLDTVSPWYGHFGTGSWPAASFYGSARGPRSRGAAGVGETAAFRPTQHCRSGSPRLLLVPRCEGRHSRFVRADLPGAWVPLLDSSRDAGTPKKSPLFVPQVIAVRMTTSCRRAGVRRPAPNRASPASWLRDVLRQHCGTSFGSLARSRKEHRSAAVLNREAA